MIMGFKSITLIALILAMSFFTIAIAVRMTEALICIEPNRKLMVIAETFFVGGVCLGTLSVLLYFAYAISKLIV